MAKKNRQPEPVETPVFKEPVTVTESTDAIVEKKVEAAKTIPDVKVKPVLADTEEKEVMVEESEDKPEKPSDLEKIKKICGNQKLINTFEDYVKVASILDNKKRLHVRKVFLRNVRDTIANPDTTQADFDYMSFMFATEKELGSLRLLHEQENGKDVEMIIYIDAAIANTPISVKHVPIHTNITKFRKVAR